MGCNQFVCFKSALAQEAYAIACKVEQMHVVVSGDCIAHKGCLLQGASGYGVRLYT